MSYDIFFISYDETDADKNWKRVQESYPNAQRVSNIPSISEAHVLCNELATTDRFWTIDGDNWLLAELPTTVDGNIDLLFFNAMDPIDGHTSSIGGIKLWKKNSFVNTDMSNGDFCRHATNNSLAIQYTLSEHRYNSTPYESWRHAFRHMTKCLSNIIPRVLEYNSNRFESHKDLNSWSYQGYLDAKKYVNECYEDFEKINLINDYNWLKTYFITQHPEGVISID